MARFAHLLALTQLTWLAGCMSGEVKDSAQAHCEMEQQCSEFFEMEYDSLDDCFKDHKEGFRIYKREEGRDCALAAVDWQDCYVASMMIDCDEEVAQDSCADVEETRARVCGF